VRVRFSRGGRQRKRKEVRFLCISTRKPVDGRLGASRANQTEKNQSAMGNERKSEAVIRRAIVIFPKLAQRERIQRLEPDGNGQVECNVKLS
jgi:hypothetical protein